MRATGERRSPWADHEQTDPHGFAPVQAPPAPAVPRQRGDRPSHDPWDPAYTPDTAGTPADRPVDVDRDGYPARRSRHTGAPRRRAGARDRGTTATRVADPGPSPEPGLLCGTDPADAYRYPDQDRPARGTRPRRPARPDGTRATGARSDGDRSHGDRSHGARSGATRSGGARSGGTTRTRRRDPLDTGSRDAADPRSATMLAPGPRLRTIAIPAAVGSLVAVGIGVWARAHDPTGVAVNLAGFSSGPAVKTWLATLALVLALGQGWTGMVLHGRVGSGPTPLTTTVHRWSGRLAVLVTLPVAVQCLFALGWSGATTRTLLHSLLGCVFYGAFVTKMLLLNRRGVPGWVIAVCGGLLLAVLSGIWLTSAAWFFGTHGLTF